MTRAAIRSIGFGAVPLVLTFASVLSVKTEERTEELKTAEQTEIVRSAVADLAGVPSQFGFSHGFGSGAPVALGDGQVLLVYRPTMANQLESAISSDGGKTWVRVGVVLQNPLPDVTICRPAAVRTRIGTIWVFYFGYVRYDRIRPENSKSDVWAVRSSDGGRTWQDHHRIWEGYAGMLNGAIETQSGNILLPISYPGAPGRWVGACLVSTDRGKQWRFVGGIDIGEEVDADRRSEHLDGGGMEPTVVQLSGGRVWMLLRTITGKLWQSSSGDQGLTWSKPAPTKLSCGGPMYVTRLASGRLALVGNQADWSAEAKYHYPHGFDEASIALSDDEGVSWHQPVVFARARRVCHSLLLETAPGRLLITMPSRPLLLRTTESALLQEGRDNSRAGSRETIK